MEDPHATPSPFVRAQGTSRSSMGSSSITGLEVDKTAFGLQPISHEADQWMVLQPHSDLESSPCELSSGNCPQVHYGSEHLETNRDDDPKETAGHVETQKGEIRRCRRYLVLVILLFTIVLVAVVLSSSLTHLLRRRHFFPTASSQDPSALMTEVDLGSPSKSGAFNGTAITIIDRREFDDAYHLFYQHHDGRLKHLVSSNPRMENWTESGDFDTLASNARDRTPLATVVDANSLYLFYVDKNNHIQQVVYSNGSHKWQPGFRNPADNDTSNTLLVALGFDRTSAQRHPAEELAFSLYYGSGDGLVHGIIWGSTFWRETNAFTNSSGCNGVVTEQGGYTQRYIFTVDSELLQIQSWLPKSTPEWWGPVSNIWIQDINTMNISLNPFTPLYLDGNTLGYVDSDRHVSIVRSIDAAMDENFFGDPSVQLPAKVTPASQIGVLASLSIFYMQTSGNDISALGMNEDGSYSPVPNPV